MITKEVKLREFEDYLYTNLKEIVDDTGDPLLAAYRISLMIACHSDEVDLTRLEFYLSRLELDRTVVESAIKYFVGAGFLRITEQCELNDPTSPEFQTGLYGFQHHTELWLKTKGHITDFRHAFWEEGW